MNVIRKLVVSVSMGMLCAECLAATVCPRCKGATLPEDVFCASCGWKLLAPYSTDVSKSVGWTPLKLSLIGPVAFPYGGLDVYGLHLSAIGGSCEEMGGVSVGGIFSICKQLKGISVCGFLNSSTGTGFFDVSHGIQIGAYNTVLGGLRGCQVGVINRIGAKSADGGLTGLQLGVVNYAEQCSCGLQIGLINIIMENKIKVLPLLNEYF